MVEITMTVANNDLRAVRRWAEDTRRGLYRDMASPVPNAKSNRATLVYAMLGSITAQIAEHQDELKARERRGR